MAADPDYAGVRVALRDSLSKNATRVVDLFREWDEDGNGKVTKSEFRKALPMLGLQAEKSEMDNLFDAWDPDKSGSISLAELTKLLRRGGEVELDEKLQGEFFSEPEVFVS